MVFVGFLHISGASNRCLSLHRAAAVKAQVEPRPEGGGQLSAGTALVVVGAVDNAPGRAARRQGALMREMRKVEDKSMTPEQEIKQAKEYLARLLKAVYPDIHPLGDLLGLISQVDNGFAVPLIKAQRHVQRTGLRGLISKWSGVCKGILRGGHREFL